MRGRRVSSVTALVLACAGLLPFGCKSSSSPSPSADAGPTLPSEASFPPSFMWGTSTAAFQVEKGDSHTDWAHWASTPGKIAHGDNPDVGGDDALAHVDDDIALMKSEGHNAYRMSVEWGRIYPTRADFDADTPDPNAIAAYEGELSKLKAAGISPMVTLSHFALPDWLEDFTKAKAGPVGWEVQETSDLFVTFCSRIAARWGKYVDWWITLNEPLNVLLGGYLQGSFPPGLVLEIDRGLDVARAEARVHGRAYDAIHAADTIDADGDGKAAWVSIAAHLRTYHPYDATDPDDAKAADHARYVANDWILNAIVRGDWDDDLDGTYTGPNDKQADPTLKGKVDYIGVNYYSDTLISAHTGLVIPTLNFAVFQQDMPTSRPKTDFGWDIYPEGFGTVLDEAAGYGLPIVVTENGVADQNDVMRGRFIAEHMLEMGAAIQRGDDVRGYFHWSLLDNFEWASGFCPKFGLHSVDHATGARTARASAGVFSDIIRAGKVTQAQIDAMPAYGAPTPCE